MKLATDFLDYYDHAFDTGGLAFERYAVRGAPHRRDDHDRLERAGFRVPARGTPEEVVARWPATTHMVVYIDPHAHAGEGKLLVSAQRARLDYAGDYCSAFVGDPDAPGFSIRLLLVGDISFWLFYAACDGWRSNVGDVAIDEAVPPTHAEALIDKALTLGAPLVAVDFVRHTTGALYAIDLNTAPGLRGTVAEKRLRPSVVRMAIEARMRVLGTQ